jgi:ABC-type multidrug transport system fused ATPase/permease subunit
MKELWALMEARERRGAIVLTGLMIVGMLLEMLGVGLVVPLLAILADPGSYGARFPQIQSLLARLESPSSEVVVAFTMIVVVVAFVVKAAFLATLFWCQTRFAYGMQANLSQRLFAVYLSQPYSFHLQRNSAELIRNLTSEVALFTTHVLLPGLLLLTEVFVIVGLCALLFVIEPVGASIVTGTVGLAAWTFDGLTRARIAHWGAVRQHHEGRRIQHIQQGLGGAKEVKVLGREREFLEQYRLHNERTAHVSHLQATLYQLPRLWLELLAVIGLATLVLSMVGQGRALGAILTTLGLFAAAAFRLIPSANRVIAAAQTVRYSIPVVRTLHSEMHLGDVHQRQSRARITGFANELRVQNVTFAYPDASRPTVEDLSFTVRRGESVGIVGASGMGKSTLVDLLLGLLVPQTGTVTVDGTDIHWDLRGWQERIGYVPQTIFLTDDSLRRNIGFGLADDQIDAAAVMRSIRAAQLDTFVAGLPSGLDTVVGERGVRLSGGQRQRIGIARALYHDPEVLVLDEATSSLDTVTEAGVIDAVRALRYEKTVIIVAHRLSTVEQCDRLLVLDNGRAVDEGATAAVLAQGRVFRSAS